MWSPTAISTRIGPSNYSKNFDLTKKIVWTGPISSDLPEKTFVSFGLKFDGNKPRSPQILFSTSRELGRGLSVWLNPDERLELKLVEQIGYNEYQRSLLIPRPKENSVTHTFHLRIDQIEKDLSFGFSGRITSQDHLSSAGLMSVEGIKLQIDEVSLGSSGEGGFEMTNFSMSFGYVQNSFNTDILRFLILIVLIAVVFPIAFRLLDNSWLKLILRKIGTGYSICGITITVVLFLFSLSIDTKTQNRLSLGEDLSFEQTKDIHMNSVASFDWELEFSMINPPKEKSRSIVSRGSNLNQGVHLMVDKYGSPFLLMGTESADPNGYALVLLGPPIRGRHSLKFKYESIGSGNQSLEVFFDQRKVDVKSAKLNEEIELQRLRFLPLASLQDSQAEDEKAGDRIYSERIELSIWAESPIRKYVKYGLLALAFLTLVGDKTLLKRRFSSRISKRASNEISDMSAIPTDN
jgi:hypothetical protein